MNNKNIKYYDLTIPQVSILSTEQFYGSSTLNNLGGTSLISNELNFDIFKIAINNLVKHNDSFRIRLIRKDNTIKQYIEDFKPFDIDIVDLETQMELEQFEKIHLSKPFEIFEKPLFEFKLFRFKDNSGGYVLRIHHIIADAWTSGLLCRKLMHEYTCLLNNSIQTELPTSSYINYLETEKLYLSSSKFEKDKSFWNDKFSNLPDIVSLPSQHNSPDNVSCIGNRQSFIIPKNVVSKISFFCKEHSISIFNFFMSILAIYISKINNSTDFVIGTPILNRTNVIEKNTTGMFINVAPLRITLKNITLFSELLSYISKESMSLLRHQKYPYQKILQDVRKQDSTIPNLYNILLSYQITKANNESDFSYSTRWVFNGCCANDLDMHIYDLDEEGTLNISYDYKISKYSELEINNLHNRLVYIIKQVLKESSITINAIDIVTPDEKNILLNSFNSNFFNYNQNSSLNELFEQQASKSPNSVAIIDNNSKLTYKDLNEKANFLANKIKELNIKTDIIAFSLKRNSNIIITILGILKARLYIYAY